MWYTKTPVVESKKRTGPRQTKKITILDEQALCLSCSSAFLAQQQGVFVPRD